MKPSDFEPHPLYQHDLWDALESFAKDKVRTALVPDRKERESNMSAVKDEARAHLAQTLGEDEFAKRGSEFSPAWKSLEKKSARGVISDGVRLDGRGRGHPSALRTLGSCPVHTGVAVRAGDTQAPRRDARDAPMNQMIDTLDLENRSDTSITYTSAVLDRETARRLASPPKIGPGLAERALIR